MLNWLRCKINRPRWEYLSPGHQRHDFSDDDKSVHRMCLHCDGLVVSNRHYNIFEGI